MHFIGWKALRAWYSQIDGHFDEKCFLKSKNEPILLVKRQGVDDILIALYVDNFVFTENNERMIKEFKKEMMKKYEISDLGLLNHFIGMEIYQREKGVIICQKKYVENVLKNSKYMVVI